MVENPAASVMFPVKRKVQNIVNNQAVNRYVTIRTTVRV